MTKHNRKQLEISAIKNMNRYYRLSQSANGDALEHTRLRNAINVYSVLKRCHFRRVAKDQLQKRDMPVFLNVLNESDSLRVYPSVKEFSFIKMHEQFQLIIWGKICRILLELYSCFPRGGEIFFFWHQNSNLVSLMEQSRHQHGYHGNTRIVVGLWSIQ